MWHRVAPALAEHFTTVVVDLRGYGSSDAPPDDEAHTVYSKRVMGDDLRAVMAHLGHERFAVVGHDRGRPRGVPHGARHARARGARRGARHPADRRVLGPPQPDVRRRHLPLDVPRPAGAVPGDADRWCPAVLLRPLPGAAGRTAPSRRRSTRSPSSTTGRCSRSRPASPPCARTTALVRPSTWRWIAPTAPPAGSIEPPLLDLFGHTGIASGDAHTDVWRAWARRCSGAPVDSGHFVAEENAAATLAALSAFLGGRLTPARSLGPRPRPGLGTVAGASAPTGCRPPAPRLDTGVRRHHG